MDILENMRKMLEAGEISKEDIERAFPKLKDSEDERIRKALIDFFQKKVEKGFEWVEYGIPNNAVLAYLERQKGKVAEFDHDREQKTNPYSGTGFDYNGHHWAMCARDGGVEIIVDGRRSGVIEGREQVVGNPEEYGLCKPSEWSEEDENTLECSDSFKRFVDMVHSVDKGEFTEFEYSIINFVLACCDKNIAMTPKGIHCYAKTILNIVKKEFTPKNCGWTDEEETVLHNACEFIRHRLNDSVCRNGNIDGMDYNILYEKLKSLRPQPHWKPSKKQIDALNSIILTGSFTYVGQTQDLISLKDDLKKL